MATDEERQKKALEESARPIARIAEKNPEMAANIMLTLLAGFAQVPPTGKSEEVLKIRK